MLVIDGDWSGCGARLINLIAQRLGEFVAVVLDLDRLANDPFWKAVGDDVFRFERRNWKLCGKSLYHYRV